MTGAAREEFDRANKNSETLLPLGLFFVGGSAIVWGPPEKTTPEMADTLYMLGLYLLTTHETRDE